MRIVLPIVLISVCAAACGRTDAPPSSTSAPVSTPQAAQSPGQGDKGEPGALVTSAAPGAVRRGDDSTNLETTPVSAADYAMYEAVMGGASAMLSALSPEDRAALETEKKTRTGQNASGAARAALERARGLHQKDLELARMQGIETRYRDVKRRIEAVIGPDAKPPADGDAVSRENLRYLEPHRANIERLQGILRDPLGRKRE